MTKNPLRRVFLWLHYLQTQLGSVALAPCPHCATCGDWQVTSQRLPLCVVLHEVLASLLLMVVLLVTLLELLEVVTLVALPPPVLSAEPHALSASASTKAR